MAEKAFELKLQLRGMNDTTADIVLDRDLPALGIAVGPLAKIYLNEYRGRAQNPERMAVARAMMAAAAGYLDGALNKAFHDAKAAVAAADAAEEG